MGPWLGGDYADIYAVWIFFVVQKYVAPSGVSVVICLPGYGRGAQDYCLKTRWIR